MDVSSSSTSGPSSASFNGSATSALLKQALMVDHMDMSNHSFSESQESTSSNLWADVMVFGDIAGSSPSSTKSVKGDIFDILNQAQDLLDTEDEELVHVIEPTPIGSQGTVKIVDNFDITDNSWHDDDTFMDVLNPLLPANNHVGHKRKLLLNENDPFHPIKISRLEHHQHQLEPTVASSSANASFPLPGLGYSASMNDMDNNKIQAVSSSRSSTANSTFAPCVSMENIRSCLPTTTTNLSFRKELKMFAAPSPSSPQNNNNMVSHSVSMDSFRVVGNNSPTINKNKSDSCSSSKHIAKADSNNKKRSSSSSGGGGKHRNRFRSYQAEQWSDRFDELVEFRKIHGHCNVPHKFPENPLLAVWAKRQRYQYTLKCRGEHSTLTNERQVELEKLGFIWDSHRAAWEERFSELLQFMAQEGHVNVPANHPTNPSLAIWVKCQRRQYKLFCQGEQSNMTQERIVKLEAIGFIWNLRK